jgi:transcription initiation factor TFIIIB Brf1 subunit/transcription initiation factor TFIIB
MTSSVASIPKHFDISQLPSLKDGMSVEEEALKRRKTCRFIEEAGRVLKLPRVAVSTAMVFFHRFYAKHSFQDHDRFEVAVACIVLAAKTEESPKKLTTVIDECHKLKVRGMQAGRISTTGSVAALTNSGSIDPKGEEFIKLKERILLLERVILHTIGFELSIDHPYKFLVEQIQKMIHKRQLEYINPTDGVGKIDGDNKAPSVSQVMDKMMKSMAQYAMNFANDSMQTSLCLQFEPQKIATATVYLAGQFSKVRPIDGKDWLEVLNYPDVETLASISLQIVELVTERKGTDEASFARIRAEVETLRTQRSVAAGVSGQTAGAPTPETKRPRIQ